jgi:hypothetical protein
MKFDIDKYNEIQEDDDIMLMEDFIKECKYGGFIDYDGFGHPITEDNKINDNIWIKPSSVLKGINTQYHKIVWYNK